jgi:L-amino acid N-acyltransferase YncA
MITIRLAKDTDFEAIWPIFQTVVAAGTTYTYEKGSTAADARRIWMATPRATYVAEDDGQILGTYFIKTNQGGHGAHVCNCGFMVAEAARGRGLAALMCAHAQDEARRLGYKAMQFNFVVATNTAAIHLWHKLGFETVGRLPKAFDHPGEGLVDVFVMYKWLED